MRCPSRRDSGEPSIAADYVDAVREAERKELSTKLAQWVPDTGDDRVETMIGAGSAALSIIERVVSGGFDLVVVTSDEDKEDRATIRRLLRKCPCPVWVIRPTGPEPNVSWRRSIPIREEVELNRTILELAASMVNLEGGELHVVHAWELYGEATMRSSGFVRRVARGDSRACSTRNGRNTTTALDRSARVPLGGEIEPWRST